LAACAASAQVAGDQEDEHSLIDILSKMDKFATLAA
jgi:hypothetical protein